MHRIAVCVCTYNRPLGLRATIASMDKQRFDRLADDQVHVIVVDNSPEGAEARSSDLSSSRFSLSIVHEPRKGLSAARNTAFAASRRAGASHVAFVDDDELAHPDWLESLYAVLIGKSAAAAIGPVIPIFEKQPQGWLPLRAYIEERRPNQGFVDDGYTGNMICALSTIDANGLSFDDRFNATGGEDTFFFKQLREKGLKVAWAEHAIIVTVVPKNRMTVGWVWRRWYRSGDVEAHLGTHPPSTPAGRLINLVRGTARLLIGSVHIVRAAIFEAWRRPEAVVASFYTACRGAGLVANAFGYRHEEYKRAGDR